MPDHPIPRHAWFLAAAGVVLLSSLAFRWPSAPTLEAPAAWLPLACCLALWVPVGLALLAGGGLTDQRAALMALMSLLALGIASLGYFLTGFAFQFGGVGLVNHAPAFGQLIWEWSPLDKDWGLGWGVIGLRGFLLGTDAAHPQAYLLFLSQLTPLTVAALLPLLALRGRTRPFVWIISTMVLSMFTFPVVGNWVWGGGWLASLGLNAGLGHGFLDFAGAGTVHLIGAATALAGLLVFLPPSGSREDGAPPEMPLIHLPMLALMGSFLLIPGWIGLALSNPLLSASDIAWPIVAVNFVLAGVAGALVALVYSWFTTGVGNIFMTVRGLVSGLVALSAAAPFVPAWSALVIGGLAGLLLPLSSYVLTHVLRLDDQSLIVPMHGVSAAWGLVMAALFADGRFGVGWNGVGANTYLGISGQGVTGYLAAVGAMPDFPQQLYVQLIGLLAIFFFTFVVSWVVFKCLAKLTLVWEGLHVTPMLEPGLPSTPAPEPAVIDAAQSLAEPPESVADR